jgi:hypothetical protein
MKPSTLTIFELFERDRRYVVPLFQRPYVWGQEKQWEPLWIDITSKANEVLSTSGDEARIRKHFLGAVVLNNIKTFGRQVSAMDVVDGQQRLTTLQILLTAFRDYVRTSENQELDTTLERLTANSCRMEDEFEKYKVWPTTTDRAVFEKVTEAKSLESVRTNFPLTKRPRARKYTPRPKLAEAYLYFYEAIRAYALKGQVVLTADNIDDDSALDAPESTEGQRLEALIDAISKHLELVIIELEDRDDPQVIFETLNARGEPLLPSDLIRNFVFLEATRRREDVSRLYKDYWRGFDESSESSSRFWTEEERQGRFKRPRLDLFVFHFLACQTERDILISHLFQEFRDWWNSETRTVESELQRFKNYSDVFRKFFVPDRTTRLGVFANRLRTLDTSTVYPLLLFLVVDNANKIPQQETEALLADLESYLIRRMVCKLTTKSYNRVFLQLLRNLRKTGLVDSAEMRKQLLGLEGDSGRWPNDNEFRKAWMDDDAYRNHTSQRLVMLLSAIDLHMETSKQEQIHLDGNLTVEHVMPQSWLVISSNWPTPLIYTSEEDKRAYESRKHRFIHSFGNLTLLTQPLNSSISNGPFSKKRGEIAKQSRLRLNVYFQQFTDQDDWNEVTIKKRGEELFEVARIVWPYP